MKIKNIEIQRVIMFLRELSIKGIAGIHRTKIVKHLTGVLEEVAEGEKTIREDFAEDDTKLTEELIAYFNEEVVIGGDEFTLPIASLKQTIKKLISEDSDKEFSGDDADTLFLLYEALKIDEEETD